MVGEGENPEATRIRIVRPDLKWWIAGLIVFGIIAAVVFTFLPWVVLGLFIYYVARPINRRLRPRLGGFSPAVSLLLIVVPVVLFLGVFLAVAIGQLAAFASSDMATQFLAQSPVNVGTIPNDPDQLVNAATTTLQDPSVQSVIADVQAIVGGAAASLSMMFLSVLFAFFVLSEDRRLARWGRKYVLGDDALSISYLEAVDEGLNSVYFGYTLTIFAIMVLTAIIYNVFNLFAPGNLLIPATILLAVITGIFTLVPIVGRSIIYLGIAAILAVGAIQRDPTFIWYPFVFFLFMALAFDNVVRTYIRPYLSGKMFHLSLVMFAYLLGPSLFGWYGIFLGPLVMVIVVQFLQVAVPQLRGEEPMSDVEIGPTATQETDESRDDVMEGGEATDGGQ
ncbi:AI-2E family transporter [Haladaptatus sp. NG-WS-4]